MSVTPYRTPGVRDEAPAKQMYRAFYVDRTDKSRLDYIERYYEAHKDCWQGLNKRIHKLERINMSLIVLVLVALILVAPILLRMYVGYP